MFLRAKMATTRRQFDKDEALNSAMKVFWRKGYASSSLADLTKTMGINKPSMYSAFGNKEALFIKATQLYIDTIIEPTGELLAIKELPLKERLRNYMMTALALQCDPNNMKGCYLAFCRSEVSTGEIPAQAENMLKEFDVIPPPAYIDLFKEDPESIELGLDKRAYENAMAVFTILKGTASMARSGVDKASLEFCIDSVIAGIGLK
jgi:AcrR family transcriptional regulator